MFCSFIGRRCLNRFSQQLQAVRLITHSQVVSNVSSLSADECMKQLSNSSHFHYKSNRLFMLFNRLKELNALTTEAFELLMAALKFRGDVYMSIDLMNEHKKSSLPLTSNFYSSFLSVLVDRPMQNAENQEIFHYLNKNYDSDKASLINSAHLFVNLCILFCRHRHEKAVDILVDMISAHLEPSQQLCLDLLNVALLTKEVKVLRVLTGWYSKAASFRNYRLEFGHLNRILEISGGEGDSVLASTTIEVIT